MERAVDYNRVSTEEEAQLNALENQIAESAEAILRNGWTHVRSYIDEGKSGTTTKQRNAYNKLLEDMEKDDFDIVVIKSQDRLMRNTKEWYIFVDKLLQYGKKLYFYIENKFYSPDDSLITGIRAILAEEYSRELSKKINNAHKNRQEKGTTVLITSKTWGYEKKGKQVIVNEKEADIIILIYNLCLQEYGSRSIAKILSNKGIKNRAGNDFAEGTVRRIIRNPLFMGTVVMNKRHLNFNTKKNNYTPESEWKVHENLVPAIVSKEIWTQANVIMDKRCVAEKTEDFVIKKRGKNLGRYDLSGKIYCGECGNVFWRRYRKTSKGIRIIEWSCREYVKKGRKKTGEMQDNHNKMIPFQGGCDNIHINDIDLNDILYDVAKEMFFYKKEEILDNAMNILSSIIGEGKDTKLLGLEKEKILNRRNLLLNKFLDGSVLLEMYKRKDEELKLEYDNICQNINRQELDCDCIALKHERLEDIRNDIQDISNHDLCVHRLLSHIEKIEVFPDRLKICFDVFQEIKVKIEQLNFRNKKFTLQNFATK